MTSKKVDVWNHWNVPGYSFNVPPPLPAPPLSTMTSMPQPERTAKKLVNSKWIPENNLRKSENYRQNNKDVRPRKPRSYRTGLRDRYAMPSRIYANDQGRHNHYKMKLPYGFGNRFFNKNNNDQRNPKEDEGCNLRHIGLDYKRTSVKPEIDWQTNQQMDEYGLLGGCCRKGDHLNHECCRSEETSQPSYRSGCRSQSLSRPSRDKMRKPLLGILKRSNSKPAVRRRSRSVCFTEKNEEFLFEVEDNDIEIGEIAKKDLQTEDVFQLETKMTHGNVDMDHSLVKSMPNENRIIEHIIAVEKQPYFEKTKPLTSEKAKPNEPNRLDSKALISSERGHGLNELDAVCRLEGNVTNMGPKNLINEENPDKMTLSNVNPERKFHGFTTDDISNEMAQLELRTFIIQMENKCEDDCQEFVENNYDVLMDQDNIEGLLDNAAAQFNRSFESSHMKVQNYQIILGNNKTNAILQTYFTPIHDLDEDYLDLSHIIGSSLIDKEPFLKSQEELFQIETNVALNNVHGPFNSNDKSSKCSQYVDNSFDIKNRFDSHMPILVNGEEFDQTPPIQCNKKLLTKITESCQSIPKSSNDKDPKTSSNKIKPVLISVRRLKLKMKPLRISVNKLKLNRNSVKIGALISNNANLKEDLYNKQIFPSVCNGSTDSLGETDGDSTSPSVPRGSSCIIRISKCTLDESDT